MLKLMEVNLTPEQQHQLSQLAAQQGCDEETLARQAIERFLDEEAQFIEAVRFGEEALDRGEYLTHEEVGRRIQELFRH